MALKGLLDLPDHHVAAGSIDARGWPLLDATGEPVGRIVDFIVDTEALEARYVVVALDGLFREVVLSLRELDFDLKTRQAICRQATKKQIEQLPYMGGTSLKPDDEQRLYATFLPEETPEHPPKVGADGVIILSIERREGGQR